MPNLKPWQDVRARWLAGDRTVTLAMRDMAEEALQEKFPPFPRPARSRTRPDFRDREAGDDSFNDSDDGMVAL